MYEGGKLCIKFKPLALLDIRGWIDNLETSPSNDYWLKDASPKADTSKCPRCVEVLMECASGAVVLHMRLVSN